MMHAVSRAFWAAERVSFDVRVINVLAYVRSLCGLRFEERVTREARLFETRHQENTTDRAPCPCFFAA